MTATAFAISGPMYPLPITPSLSLCVVRQLILGAAAGAQSIIPLSCGVNELRRAGFDDCLETFSRYASVFWAALQLGYAMFLSRSNEEMPLDMH